MCLKGTARVELASANGVLARASIEIAFPDRLSTFTAPSSANTNGVLESAGTRNEYAAIEFMFAGPGNDNVSI